MNYDTTHAHELLTGWKGDAYTFGVDVLSRTGPLAARCGDTALLVATGLGHYWAADALDAVMKSLDSEEVYYNTIVGAAANAPREDVYRIANEISKLDPHVIIAFGGGSTIDAVKAASALSRYETHEVIDILGADERSASTVEPLFGVGRVAELVNATDRDIHCILAVQTAASSAAHLTKYSNITDPSTGQKKLIVDDAVVPPMALFDYGITRTTPQGLTLDGALDGVSHLWEVFMGASGKDYYGRVKDIVAAGLSLIIEALPHAIDRPEDLDARIALGYGTDLGGYAIMVGGTNGGHLGSFSLVDVTSHGRACAILNPYYTVFFADAIQGQLKTAAEIYARHGYIDDDISSLEGRALGEAVARGMINFSERIGFPLTLEAAGATEAHIDRMVDAAKNPQLASKLKNMPIPLDPAAGDIDTYMRPVLEAAFSGDLSKIRMR